MEGGYCGRRQGSIGRAKEFESPNTKKTYSESELNTSSWEKTPQLAILK